MSEQPATGVLKHMPGQMMVTPPVLDAGVIIGPGTILGLQPLATAANRRRVTPQPPGAIGLGCVIGCYCVIYANVIIGQQCRFGEFVDVREEVRIGARCIIGTNVDIQYGATIGDDVRIFNESQISGGSIIGNGSFIGPGVQTANHRHVDLGDYRSPPNGPEGVTIGERVMIGAAAILLPGVKIGDGATIGAGALVTKDVPAGVTVQGFPARDKHGRADSADLEGR
jgi:acetyltransferase-like isoleucine patch superfamily enzyme